MASDVLKTRARDGRVIASVLSALGLLALGGILLWGVAARLNAVPEPLPESSVHLVAGSRDALELSPDLIASLGIITAPVKAASRGERLELAGSLSLDPNQSVRLRSRFAGEVVTIGVANPTRAGAVANEPRPLRVGDRVSRDQLLTVVWSKDIGETKSELVDAVSKLQRDETQLKRLISLTDAVALKEVRAAQREKEADLIAIDRAERTLRSWKIDESQLVAIRAEAGKIHNDEPIDISLQQRWAEVEVRAPFDGVIMERNATLGDIVDVNTDLFVVADLSKLRVMVHAYEENLPELESLPSDDRKWTVYVKSQASVKVEGTFDTIGQVIDPTQHTAAVMGWVDNRAGHLRVGQFVTATIDLPAISGQVVIPKSALVEEGDHAFVFVAVKPNSTLVERRMVSVARRAREQIYLKGQLTGAAAVSGAEPLAVGDLVVTSGAVELAAALQDALLALPQVPPR